MPITPEEAARRRLEHAKKALRVMHGYWSEYQVLPSYAVIAERMNMSAKSWVYECVRRLIAAGHLRKSPTGQLAPGEKFFDDLDEEPLPEPSPEPAPTPEPEPAFGTPRRVHGRDQRN